jgi:hypothetical protein
MSTVPTDSPVSPAPEDPAVEAAEQAAEDAAAAGTGNPVPEPVPVDAPVSPEDPVWVSEVAADTPVWPGAFQASFGHYSPNKVIGQAAGETVTAADLNTAKALLLQAVQTKVEGFFPVSTDPVVWPKNDDGSDFDSVGLHGDTIKVSVYYG